MANSGIISFLVFLSVLLLGFALTKPAMDNYMDTYSVRVKKRNEKEIESQEAPKSSAMLILFEALGKQLITVAPFLVDKRTVELLSYANYRTKQHLHRYMGIKVAVGVFCIFWGVCAAISNPVNILTSVFTILIGWTIPNFFLAGRAKQRQTQIIKELPTVLDLLIVTSQAGLSLLAGVDKLSKETVESCPLLALELQQLINDVKMFAKSVPVAMREMGERCGVEELINMASGLIAAESKGADISYPLRQQAEALRDRLKRKQEEIAAKVPVKMVPVIMLFVMPLILLPMLGPAGLTIVSALGPSMGGGTK